MTSYRKIGFIGTGIMGAPMARNLAKAGFEVEAYDYFAEKAEALASDGVTPVKTAVEGRFRQGCHRRHAQHRSHL